MDKRTVYVGRLIGKHTSIDCLQTTHEQLYYQAVIKLNTVFQQTPEGFARPVLSLCYDRHVATWRSWRPPMWRTPGKPRIVGLRARGDRRGAIWDLSGKQRLLVAGRCIVSDALAPRLDGPAEALHAILQVPLVVYS